METIRKYSNPHVARMAKADLESYGILVFLKNENFAETMPMYGSGMTEIELQVEKEETERALEILGPDKGDRDEVEKISRKLNRLLGISLIAAMAGFLTHALSHGFETQQIPNSIGLGFIAGLAALLIQGIFSRFRAQPPAGGDADR